MPPHCRSTDHVKQAAAIAAAAAEGRASRMDGTRAPLSGLRLAVLSPGDGFVAAKAAARKGAAVAWLADEDASACLTGVWPASQPQAGPCGPYTHVVVQFDPLPYPATMAALRRVGLLPPRANSGGGGGGETPKSQLAWSPPPGAPTVVPSPWVVACNVGGRIMDAEPWAAELRAAIAAAEAPPARAGSGAALFQGGGGSAPPSAAKRPRHYGRGAVPAPAAAPPPPLPPLPGDGGDLVTPPPPAQPARARADGPARLRPPLPLPAPCSPDTACALVAADAEADARHGEGGGGGGGEGGTPHVQRYRGIVTFTNPAPRPRPGGLPPARFKWTGGGSGITWGAGDVWMEPFDPKAVRETLDALADHWMPTATARRRRRRGRASGGGALGGGGGGSGGALVVSPGAGRPGSGSEEEEEDDDDDRDGGPFGYLSGAESDGGDAVVAGVLGAAAAEVTPALLAAARAAPLALNGVCPHRACAARPFCLVAKLRHFVDVAYSRTGADGASFFRGRATRPGVVALEEWPLPLRTPADVDRLHTLDLGGRLQAALGERTRAKIKELLAAGTLARLEAALADEGLAARKALCSVWGVGEAAARRWVAAGLTTVDALRSEMALPPDQRRPGVGSLTSIQALGLEHAADFAARIPAAEVDTVVRDARVAAFSALGCDAEGYRPGATPGASSSPAHVRACGSWLRAHAAADIPAAAAGLAAARQADYGDIDLLIVGPPPPPPSPPPPPGAALQAGPSSPASPSTYRAAAEAATRANRDLLVAVLEGLAGAGYEVKTGTNADRWAVGLTPWRLDAKVSRSTFGDGRDGEVPPSLLAGSGPPPGAPASWMGAIRLPLGHPALQRAGGRPPDARRWRRLDLKVYARPALALAVSYFTGDGSFNRALRYWAKTAPAAKASAVAHVQAAAAAKAAAGGVEVDLPLGSDCASGWHLSDTYLFPIRQATRSDTEASRLPVGPPVVLACETDIFTTLGLAYVPPFCRTFTSRKAREAGGIAGRSLGGV